MKFNNCQLQIVFRFNSVNGSSMTVKVRTGTSTKELSAVDNTATYNAEVCFPFILHLEFFGKDNNLDTILDSDGKIVADKNVIIEKIILDGFTITDQMLVKLVKFTTTNGDVLCTNYIGFNGNMALMFDGPDVFRQLMKFKREAEK